ncbi:MAG: tRNA dihydrouridine(20/20a) synthase DusA [Nanoarchaeota archaeon]
MISIAPMVDVTDRHFRYMCRLLTKETMLYTEMITAPAIIHGNTKSLLDFKKVEKPIALQIAGSNPDEIAEAIKIAEKWDYDEININAGCPSEKVSEYDMGLTLMLEPKKVAEIVAKAKEVTKKPITVKHRIGIDATKERNKSRISHEYLKEFVEIIKKHRVNKFIIHARIGVIGLDPKKNRSIPPLNYEAVYSIKRDFPELYIEINGGIRTSEEIKEHLKHVDGVMIGRVAYENPMFLSELDSIITKKPTVGIKREQVIETMLDYIKKEETNSEEPLKCRNILKHLQNIYHGEKGSKKWKRLIMPPWKNKKASEILENGIKEIKKTL